MRILVTICTRNRPILLEKCLLSVINQVIPEGVALELAVIENNDRLTMEPVIAPMRAASGLPIHHVLEAELGLPFARNRCGTFGAENGYDWTLFIDDDEVAHPDWLSQMVEASRTIPADVYYGRVIAVYPPGTPDYLALPTPNKRVRGAIIAKAEGHNTMLHRRIFANDGLAMRFDTAMRFTGGSDTDFFSRVHEAGAKMVWIGEAVVDELIPASRMTLKWQLHRTYRVAINLGVLDAKKTGKPRAFFKAALKGAGRLTGGIISLPLGLLGKRHAFKAAKQIASGLGSFGFIIGLRPQPYRVVDGG